MLGVFRLLQITLLILYPIVTHVAVYLHNPNLALVVLMLLIISSIQANKNSKNIVLSSLLVASLIGIIIISMRYQNFLLLYFPPIIISAMMLWIFSRTLMPKHEPLITSFARIIYHENSLEVQQYTRRVTQLWSLFFLVMLIESILLSLFVSPKIWSLFCNILNYAFIGLLFVGEGLYRKYRFKNLKVFLPLIKYFSQFGITAWIKNEVTEQLPLIKHKDLQAEFAIKNGKLITCADFLADIDCLMKVLPKSKYIINLCEDRYYFSVLFACALLRKQIIVLPNNNSLKSLQRLQTEFTDNISVINLGVLSE